ncbi:alanine aminotransferase 2-like [Anableps anableps]
MSSMQEVNPRVLGIRDPVSLQSLAARITEEIAQGGQKPFQRVLDVSSGDPHRAGMPPLSFARQVLAVCLYPELLKESSFPPDVRQRAQKLLGVCNGGSVGSYSSSSCGIPQIQKSVAEFITRRDGGVASDPEDIIFSSGSQRTLMLVLHLLSSGNGSTQTGVLTPLPCPHTLPMLLDEVGVKSVPYRLLEERGWALDLEELHCALEAARGHCEPRAIYISNPGNPTGHVQDLKTIEEVIRFAASERLVLLVEEVYQDSVFGQDKKFLSYKKVLFEMGASYSERVEMVSFHSISTGTMGECGLRGGYMEVINMDLLVKNFLMSMQAPCSPPVLPQLALELMVNPPSPGDASYEVFTQEILQRAETLSQNAQRACEFLNDVPGMSCQPAMGGLFLYPRLHLPAEIIQEAKVRLQADVLYCKKLLEEEGVCLGPGSENGHDDDNYHIRRTEMSSVQEVNPRVRGIRHAVNLQSLAAQISEQIAQGEQKTFKEVIDLSSCDPHRAGMPPISFVRQVLSMCCYPELLKEDSFPLDVKQRTQKLLDACKGGSIGSYSSLTVGLPPIQRSVAEFLTRRDGGISSNPEDIIFSNGSQKTLAIMLHLLSSEDGKTQTGVLTPLPCPHTLPMLLDEVGVKLVPYRLVEEQGWALDLEELHRALVTARRECEPRAIYISNPGNPTGHVQDRETIEKIIHFAASERLILLVEEVYQDSVFGQDKKFVSYKKVLFEMGVSYSETLEMVSFHSISTATIGECGLRGGYMEVINLDPAVKNFLFKAPTSPSILSQLVMEIMVNPPVLGDASYEEYTQEILLRAETLSQNAGRACELLNSLPGMSCQPAMGGVFLYPRLHLPADIMKEAEMLRLTADILYCQMLLEEEGICLGPGCENVQDDENFHIRLCVLAPPAVLEDALTRLRSFHLRLLNRPH